MKRRWAGRVVALAGAVLLVATLSGGAWLAMPQPLLPEAAAALRSTERVTFSQTDRWLGFWPASQPARAGLILYPGGKVKAEAYGPAAAAIAEQGYAVFILPMPFNLAVLGVDRASEVQAAHPQVTRWAIGGHSLGGAMAAEYAARHPGQVQGVLFWAAYASAGLSGQPLEIVSAYGTLDRSRDAFTSAEARSHLPPGAIFLALDGGNHEQFGYYTGQMNDAPATITRAAQQAQAVAAAVMLLEAVSP